MLGSHKTTAIQRMGLRKVLVPEHSDAEISLSACQHERLSQKGGFLQIHPHFLSGTERDDQHAAVQQFALRTGSTKPYSQQAPWQQRLRGYPVSILFL